MKCPYCEEKLKEGVIYGDRYKLKWISEDDDRGILLQTITKGIKLSDLGKVKALYCEKDKVVIINVP